MSGSSSGSGGGSFTGRGQDCAALAIETQLASPKPAVVSKLKKDDVLEVTLQTTAGTTTVVAKFDGALAGGLASPQLARLRECLDQGVKFEALVLQVNHGQVKVRVKAAQ